MNLVRRFVVTALSVLVVAAVAAVLVLGRPAPGPLPFPSSQPVALVSIPASAEPRASAVPSSAEPLVLPAIDPEDPPGALAGPCLTSMGIVDYAVPPSIASERRRSFSVILGTATAVGRGQWNTVDGQPPADRHQREPVMRFIRVRVDENLDGVHVPSEIVVWLPGGKIGCQTWQQSNVPGELAVGDRAVIFVAGDQPVRPVEGLRSAVSWLPIDAGGRVHLLDGPVLTMAEVRAGLGG